MLFLLRIIPSFNRSLPLSQFHITVTRLVPNILFFYNKVKCPHLQKKVGLVFPSITVHKFGSVFQNFIAGVTTLLHVVSNTEILYLCMRVMYEHNYSHAMHILSSVRLNCFFKLCSCVFRSRTKQDDGLRPMFSQCFNKPFKCFMQENLSLTKCFIKCLDQFKADVCIYSIELVANPCYKGKCHRDTEMCSFVSTPAARVWTAVGAVTPPPLESEVGLQVSSTSD